MNIEQYYPNQFLKDLSKLSLKKPNSVILGYSKKIGVDNTTIFFGGQEWEHCVLDMQVSEYKNYFALSIFAMVCNDLNMHANFNLHYPKFRKFTNYPKFGWSGFAPHFESPEWLIKKPVSLGIVNFENETLKQFAALWKATIIDFFTLHIPEILPTQFIEKLCNDDVFTRSSELTLLKNYLIQD